MANRKWRIYQSENGQKLIDEEDRSRDSESCEARKCVSTREWITGTRRFLVLRNRSRFDCRLF